MTKTRLLACVSFQFTISPKSPSQSKHILSVFKFLVLYIQRKMIYMLTNMMKKLNDHEILSDKIE